jgi:pilus assembly protein CpaE
MATRVLAVDDSAITLRLITQSLANTEYQVVTATNGREALQQMEVSKPDIIVLDVMMPEMNGYEVCRLIRRNPTTAPLPVLMLSAQNTLEDKVKGYEAGADDYLTKPFEAAELHARLTALLRRSAPKASEPLIPAKTGKTIAVFSLRGGSGVSTVAANLALGLGLLWRCSTVLVDLALSTAHAALMLNLSPRASWANIAQRPVAEIDQDLLSQIMAVHESGSRLLAAPRESQQAEALTPGHVSTVLTLLSQRFDYVVLDLAHNWDEVTLAALDRADQILLLVVPELAGVISASTALETIASLGYPPEKVCLVLSHLFERRYLSQGDIEAALNRRMDVIIPFAPSVLIPALNAGTPPVLTRPETEIGALLEDLSFYVSIDAHRTWPPAKPSPSWSRVSKRLEKKRK